MAEHPKKQTLSRAKPRSLAAPEMRRSPQPTSRDCPASWTYAGRENADAQHFVICHECGKRVKVNYDGTIRKHVPPGVPYRKTLNSQLQASKYAERNKRILKLRAEGHKLQEIGNAVGLTRERVRQILLDLDARAEVS